MKAAEIFKKNFGVKTESPYLRTPEKITGTKSCYKTKKFLSEIK